MKVVVNTGYLGCLAEVKLEVKVLAVGDFDADVDVAFLINYLDTGLLTRSVRTPEIRHGIKSE